MSIYFGYTEKSESVDELTKKCEALSLKSTNIKKAVVSLSTFVYLTNSYTTVFEINVGTSTAVDDHGLKLLRSQDEKYTLTQTNSWNKPTKGIDFIGNSSAGFMHFMCHELMYPNVSIFVVCSVLSTSVRGDWCYLIGNDNGAYDKFIGYTKGVTNKLSFGGSYPVKKLQCTLPSSVDITTKHLISCHWLMANSCLWSNGVEIPGSGFTVNKLKTGEPFASIFYNDRIPSSTGGDTTVLVGKIYGIKIVTGLITSEDILKIHTELITEHSIVT